MTLTINTNMASLTVQHNMDNATKSLNQSIERMTTGYKINAAKDDAAGYSVMTKMDTNLRSTSVCQSNVAMGSSLLSTLENNYDIMIDHMQRIRDLTEEAANGTYSTDSLTAINSEIEARFTEIDRIASLTDYNGKKLMTGALNNGVNIQVGIDSSTNSTIALEAGLFADAKAGTLIGKTATEYKTLITTPSTTNIKTALDAIDKGLADITSRQTSIGAYQNRLDSAADALTIQYDNLSSSLSTVRDTDVASESSNFIKAQILQQASASLLTTANQTPSIALNLI